MGHARHALLHRYVGKKLATERCCPVCRAENSNTTRHLAEFWMIEPELAFADLEDDMNCAEDYVRHCCKVLLETCQ